MEELHELRTKGAQFQLKARIERARVAHPRNGLPVDQDMEGEEEEEEDVIGDDVTFEETYSISGEDIVISDPTIPHQG